MKNRNKNTGRKYARRYIAGILAAVMAAVWMPSGQVKAENMDMQADTAPAGAVGAGDITLTSKNKAVPVYKAGEDKEWILTVANTTKDKTIKNIVVQPDLGDTAANWPFHTEQQDYKQSIPELVAGETKDLSFKFTQREDVPTTRYTLQFSITADGMDAPKIQKLYVNTTAKASDSPKPQAASDAGAGGFSNGDAVYSGGGSGGGDGSGSVPRVIVTGFTTTPAEVRAGQDFTLTVHLKNTSKTSRVQNMLFDMQAPTEGKDEQSMAPAFLPASGSSSVYLDGIDAEGTADISINLNAKSDLLQKPYSIELSMKYEDSGSAQIEAASSLSIPVKQDARFEFSEFEVSPESIQVGEEANIMFSLYNLGRIKLYNVKATFEGKNIKKEEVFVGNVESGASASIDGMLEGTKAGAGPGKVTMTLSYEDEAGKVSQKKEEFQLEVIEAAEDEMMPEEMTEEPSKLPVLPIVILAAIAAAAIAAAVIVKKNKKKRRKNEEEALLDELDGSSEDEWQ